MGFPLNNDELKKSLRNLKFTELPQVRDSPNSPDSLSVTVEVTIRQRTDMVLKGISLVLNHFSAPQEIISLITSQIRLYLNEVTCEKVWLKRIKYVLTYFLAKYLKSDLPPKPDKDFKFSGRAKRWVKIRLLVQCRKNTGLWFSWLQCKRCTLPLSEDYISSSYKDHYKTLTKEDPCPPPFLEDVMSDSTFSSFLGGIADELAQSTDSSFPDSQPSLGACFENPRSKGGQTAYLRSLVMPPLRSCKKDFLPFFSMTDELWSMHLIVLGKHDRLFVKETRAPIGYEYWSSLPHHDELSKEMISYLIYNNLPYCTVHAILEPNKCRTITMEPAFLQYYNKNLQKRFHSILRKKQGFSLIGRKVFATDLIDLAEKARPDDQWFSIDYSNATDGLSRSYSRAVAERVFSKLDSIPRYMALASLGMHELCYPTVVEGRREVHRWGTMRNGQLMGGILSFLILCLCNLGLYLKVTRDYQKHWSLQERLSHVLINGDDMVYAANPKLWSVHSEFGKLLGLENSVGKSYLSPFYLNINSTSFHYDLRHNFHSYEEDDYDDFEGHWFNCPRFSWFRDPFDVNDVGVDLDRERNYSNTPIKIPYLNSGLFYGIHKVQGESTSDLSYRIEDYSSYDDILTYREYKSLCSSHDPTRSDYHRRIISADDFWQTKTCSSKTFHRLFRKAEINNTESYIGLVDCFNEIISGSLPGKQKELLSQLIREHKSLIERETLAIFIKGDGTPSLFNRNLFLPKKFGGMGVELPLGFKTKISPIQKRVFYSLIEESTNFEINTQRPLVSYELETHMDRFQWFVKTPSSNIFEARYKNIRKMSKRDILSFNGILSSHTRLAEDY